METDASFAVVDSLQAANQAALAIGCRCSPAVSQPLLHPIFWHFFRSLTGLWLSNELLATPTPSWSLCRKPAERTESKLSNNVIITIRCQLPTVLLPQMVTEVDTHRYNSSQITNCARTVLERLCGHIHALQNSNQQMTSTCVTIDWPRTNRIRRFGVRNFVLTSLWHSTGRTE